MIGCGCGEKFKTQAGLNEHRRLNHARSPFTTVTKAAPLPLMSKQRLSWQNPARRAAKAASTKAQWQGPQREKLIAAIRLGQQRRRERERLEKEKVVAAGSAFVPQISLPPPDPRPVPAATYTPPPIVDVNYRERDRLREQLTEAIAALIDFEIRQALVPRVAPAPEPAPVVQPPPPFPAPETRTIPLPRADWPATRALRVHKVEPVERPPLPPPLPAEVETVTEPDDPINAHRNLSMRAAIAIAHRLGIRVRKNSAGEIEFAHPLYFRRLRVNHARHTAPRVLLTMLREVEKSIKIGKPTRVGPTGSV